MTSLRRLFDMFEQKTSLLQLLDISSARMECRFSSAANPAWCPLDECSVVTAPYEVDARCRHGGRGRPTRMAYERVIPIVTSPPNCSRARSHKH